MGERQVKALVRQIVKRYNNVRQERVNSLLRQAKTFRTLGRFIAAEETFKAKLDAAICYGLAEVCELLAEAVKKEKNLRLEDAASCKVDF